MLEAGCQNGIIKQMYESGCYFLCICKMAERYMNKEVDVVNVAQVAMEHGWIYRDFTVQKPDSIFSYLTGRRPIVSMTEQKPDCEYYVECWYNSRTQFTHFKLPDWDSLTNSVTVKEGKITSYRKFAL